MNYNIRKANINDVKDILNLQKKHEHNLISLSSLNNDLQNSLCIYFVANDNENNIIGAIGGTALVDHLDISIVVTKKDFLNKGVASSLLTKLINYCKEENVEKIFLEVRNSNLAAINLYEKFNFIKISTRKNYYKDNNEDALIYMLEI